MYVWGEIKGLIVGFQSSRSPDQVVFLGVVHSKQHGKSVRILLETAVKETNAEGTSESWKQKFLPSLLEFNVGTRLSLDQACLTHPGNESSSRGGLMPTAS